MEKGVYDPDGLGSDLRRAVAGDEIALSALLTQTYERTQARVAQRMPAELARALDVSDILQETHVTVFQRIRSFAGELPAQFERWVFAIALYKLRRALRTVRTLKRGGDRRQVEAHGDDGHSAAALLDWVAGPGRTASHSVARGEAVAALQGALQRLPDDYRDVLTYIYFDGMSIAQAAARMSRTEGAVHNLCYKARQKLRAALTEARWTFSTWC